MVPFSFCKKYLKNKHTLFTILKKCDKINTNWRGGYTIMIGQNIKYYRLKKDLTKKALASAVGLSAMAITNYEQGKRVPDIATLRKLAHELDVQIADFISTRNDNIQFTHGEFRKNLSLNESQQEYIKEAVEEYFNRFFNAVMCVGEKSLPAPIKCHELISTGYADEDAKKIRGILGISLEGPVKELVAILENKGILIFELDYANEGFSGMNGKVNEYPYIVINKNMSSERKRSTIAHELVHMVFLDINDSKENEKYAAAVSGALLIGDSDIKRELGWQRRAITNDMLIVCREYGISMWLLVVRAAQTNIISTTTAQDFYVKASKAGWRKNEPSRISAEEPTLFKQLVYRAINEENISIQKGAELLKIPYETVLDECRLMEV